MHVSQDILKCITRTTIIMEVPTVINPEISLLQIGVHTAFYTLSKIY